MSNASVTVDPKAIDALFAPHDTTHLPGCTVGVAVGGVPVYRKAFGLASMELPVALTPTMRLRIGSTTKHFCCLAFMLLVEDGKASVQDEVRKHVPELGACADGVTMKHLMQHTSGLRCSLDTAFLFAGFGSPSKAEDTMLRLMAQHDSVNTAPGEIWNYNNGGYALLTTVIERITGQRFEDVLTERILRPVGMHDTVLRRRDTEILANSASLHMPQPDGIWVRGQFGMPIAGEGALVSTVDDMLRWLAHLRHPTKVGSAETWAEMKASGVLNDGGRTGYGYGLMVGEYRGQRIIHHAGGVIGGNSQMITLPDLALDITVMCNRADLNAFVMAEKIIDACVSDLADKGDKPEAAVTGTWFSPATGSLVTLFENDGAQMIDVMGMKLPVLVTATGALRADPDVLGMSVRLLQPDAGAASALEFNSTGFVETLQPLAKAPDGMVAPLGRFASAGAGASAVLAQQDGKVTLSASNSMGAYSYALEPVGEGLWRCTPADGVGPMVGLLEAEPRADAPSFTFSSGRTRRLAFVRAD